MGAGPGPYRRGKGGHRGRLRSLHRREAEAPLLAGNPPDPIQLPRRYFRRGNKFSFIVRYRSGFSDNEGEEFDAAFTRLDLVEENAAEIRFDVMWHRHTGQWWRLHSSVTLEEVLQLIDTQGLLQPNP